MGSILTAILDILPLHLIVALGTITCLPPLMLVFLFPGWLTSGLSTQLCPPVIPIVIHFLPCHHAT